MYVDFSQCWWFPLLHRSFFFTSFSLVYFCFCCLALGEIFKKLLPTPLSYNFPPCFLLVIKFQPYVSVCNLFWIVLCVWFKINIKFHCFSSIYAVVHNTIYGRDHFSPLCILGTFVQDQLTLCVCVQVCMFSGLYSLPLVYMSTCQYHNVVITAAL